MAHEITIRENGTAEIAYAGQTPWHGLGKALPSSLSPLAMLPEAQLDWTVSKRELFFKNTLPDALPGELSRADDAFGIVRDDTGDYFGKVGRSYQPIQNKAQAEFLEALAGEGGISVEVAGSLYRGARTFWACKVKGERVIETQGRADKIKQYLILCNGHDGSLAFKAYWSPIRVVCNNTLNASFKSMVNCISIRHTTNVQNRVKAARDTLGLCASYHEQLADIFQKMADTRIDKVTYDQTLSAIFNPLEKDFDDKAKFDDALAAAGEIKTRVVSNLSKESKLFALRQVTAWDAYNSLTFFSSHQADENLSGRTDAKDRHFERVLSGDSYRIQQDAFRHCAALAGVN